MVGELAAIQATAGALKTAGELIKTLVSMKVSGEVQAKVIELQTLIYDARNDALEAQVAESNLLKRIDQLEKQVVSFEDWETEKNRYELKPFFGGSVAYVLKQSFVEAGEPPHWICPACYQKRRKSFLQPGRWLDVNGRRHGVECQEGDCGVRLSSTR